MQRPAVCDFLHGPMTSPHAVAALRDALAAGVEKHFEILYYRKDGECYLLIVRQYFFPGDNLRCAPNIQRQKKI